MQAASWRKRLAARLPPLQRGPEFASRSLHVGFVVDETGSGQVFHGVSPVFPYHKLHSTISPHSSHPFRLISSALVMVRQAWSAGTLATHGPIILGLHRISTLDPTLCWTRVEDIYLFIRYVMKHCYNITKIIQVTFDITNFIKISCQVNNALPNTWKDGAPHLQHHFWISLSH